MEDKELLKRSNQIYDEAIRRGPDESAKVLWGDVNKQYYRFAEITHFIDSMGSSILDVGCGNGAFVKFLNFHGFTGKYTGIDINGNLLKEARRDYPKFDFRNLNILSEDIEPHDYVVMSGLFNTNFGQDEVFVYTFISRMAQFSKKKTIYNAISTHVNFRDKQTCYIDPAKLIEFIIEHISPKFELRHSFIPYNFTVCIHRDDKWRSLKEIADGNS